MILHYVFEIMCDVEISGHYDEPHYERKLCEVDYDYEVDVSFKDFFDFIKPYDFRNWKEDGQNAYERACRDVWNSDWFRLDDLEEDEDFIEFMRDRYYDDALYHCEEDYE